MSNDKIEESGAVRDSEWVIAFDSYDPADEGRREAIFALGNGMFVTRAAAVDVGRDRIHYPGTYRAGCYNPIRDEIEGEPDETESLVNLPNWLPLTFRIGGGAWFQLDAVEIRDYVHRLDLYAGTTRREYVARDAAGKTTRICERRLVSMADPHLCALRFELTPLDWDGDLEFCSALDGNVLNTNVKRYEDYTHRHLVALDAHAVAPDSAMLHTRTRNAEIHIVQAMRTTIDQSGARVETETRSNEWIAHMIHTHGACGKTIGIEKVVAQTTTLDPLPGGAHADVRASARHALQRAGDFSTLCMSHERAWKRLWPSVAIDAEKAHVLRPLRFHAFHILQTISPHTAALDAGIPARGWHGEVYHGHIFWDEMFVLPFLNYRFPDLAKAMLCYRYRRLGAARAAAHDAGFRGAMYPWRSASSGHEVTPQHQKNLLSGKWIPDYTHLQRHVGSAIACNIWRYYLATGDSAFLADSGAEMMLEIARFWASVARPRADRFEIKGVIGPDEYHNAYPDRTEPGLDNNAYTNIMAAWTLCRALEVLDHIPQQRRAELRQRLDLHDDEMARWDRISRRMFVPFHEDGIISQYEGVEQLHEFDRTMLPPSLADARIDWSLRAIGKNPDAYQITKQADALTAFYMLPVDEMINLLERLDYRLDRSGLRRTAQYYLRRTAHRSSLSRVVYAGALAQIDLPLSWNFFSHALETDLSALKGESIAEGIHLGAMGGTLDILQRRYLGLSARVDGLHVNPSLPEPLGKVHLGFRYRCQMLEAESAGDILFLRSKKSNRDEVTVIVDGKKRTLVPGAEMRIQSEMPGEPC